MDGVRLTNAATPGLKNTRPQRQKAQVNKTIAEERPVPTKNAVKIALDDATRNTRFQYVIVDELDYFVVRIIDSNTDKVIKEIPSKELQRAHQGIAEAIGILFDEEI
ncbi:MAG: flagellar protein FlaG [Spirochaetales bacterium]|nr:flagellar protein FlaG [Spirochaetales bacterium]